MYWLKKYVKCEIISIHDQQLQHTLELCIRFGKPLIVTDVDKRDYLIYDIVKSYNMSLFDKKYETSYTIGDKIIPKLLKELNIY